MNSLPKGLKKNFWIIIGLRKNPEARVGGAKIRFPSLWGEKTSSHGLHHQQLLDVNSSHQEHGERGTQTTHNRNQEDGEAGIQSIHNPNQEHAEAGAQSTGNWKQSNKIWPGPSIPTARKCTLQGEPGIPMISPLLKLLRSAGTAGGLQWRSEYIHPIMVCLTYLWVPATGIKIPLLKEKRRKWSHSSRETGTQEFNP